MKRQILFGVLGFVVAVGGAGCSEWAQNHDHNVPIGGYVGPHNTVIEFPYNWDNVALECYAGDGVYVPFEGKAVFVVPNDRACQGGKP